LVTRADADESVIYPPGSAKLVFVIPMDIMKCTDDGTYVCDMYVSTNTVLNERSEERLLLIPVWVVYCTLTTVFKLPEDFLDNTI
jgi:hypothetical protein